MATKWWRYLDSLRAGRSDRELARTIEVTPATVNRWRHGVVPDMHVAVQAARALKQDVLVALVEGGFLTAQEASLRSEHVYLGEVSLRRLLEEVQSRFTDDQLDDR
ncbi:hypothetical protein H7347_10470 [Corynebacterium sp. zg-331]|uniref:hypothetical protein n=1 Tax=unclassified Corynebacterium TaxID=2624378 RepID=UPI00128DB4F9|nr:MULTISPECIES: hypothetical protein [unclassified Corynebacterium]MBC3186977.1 hypothetical protein [Corynebacterium sp. zg-331]MPV53453.1 hypothetical protein [Corynebacterium sp. zg331]